MKNGENYNIGRRSFLKGIATVAFMLPLLQSCRDKAAALLVKLTGTNHILGHRLWAKDFPKPSGQIEVPYLIIGGGISGLSACRQLVKKGISDFILLEMEHHTGGNSSSGENRYSKYPLGAHYLPLPNFHDKELLVFLQESGIITGYDAQGYPVFDEEQLTYTPQERLFYKNTWQEGLVPKFGNSAMVNEEFERFFEMMDAFRRAKGTDGKFIFDIPLSNTSSDESYRHLDALTMQQWLDNNKFTAEEVYEYVNYCCRDDFGLGADYISAWAGIHYFAARKHNAGDTYKENVLTWPEGNSRLAAHLKKYSEEKTLKQHLAYSVKPVPDGVEVLAYNAEEKRSISIKADKVIMATPQYVNKYLLQGRSETAGQFTYAPWLLATLTLSELPDGFSQPLSWDNVIYKGQGLGYISDRHQTLDQVRKKEVITYYHSFSSADTKKTRKAVYKASEDYWKDFVLNDLSAAHPAIADYTESIEIHIIGHGMISPVPGFLSGRAIKTAALPIENTIYFAHSDLSGISIFEEAFHQGINTVNQMLHETALD